jgi:hypothetical protein
VKLSAFHRSLETFFFLHLRWVTCLEPTLVVLSLWSEVSILNLSVIRAPHPFYQKTLEVTGTNYLLKTEQIEGHVNIILKN